MFTARILVILNPPVNAKTASETIARACASALRPVGLRFAIPAVLEGLLENLPEGAETIYFHASQGLSAIVPLLTDETHFLSLSGAHDFCPYWDRQLYALWRKYDKQTLFTSIVTPHSANDVSEPAVRGIASLRQMLPTLQKRAPKPAGSMLPPDLSAYQPDSVEAQPEAHLPALKEVLQDGSVTLGKGLPLVCAQQPVHTMVINPAYLFGATLFLREGDNLTAESLSLTAYLKGFLIYALHQVFLWPLSSLPAQRMMLPSTDTLPGTTLARFEQLLGFHTEERVCSAKAAMGLFGHEDIYPQRMPPRLALSQKARSARMKLLEIDMPLLVSAFIDLPNPRVASAFYLLRFGFLRRIESLPLLLYTGGRQERALRAAFPNTQSYPDGTLLPRTLLQKGMKPEELFARSKMLLLQRAASRQPEFTHTAWLDMDVLQHPVCQDAVPDFSSMMDNRIHIATVNGVPDPSFIIVPSEYLSALSKLVVSITLLDAELKRGFSDVLLWERIYHKKPAWFAIHPMPRRRMLFMKAFDPELLSPSLRVLLTELPPVYYGKEKEKPAKPSNEKESSIDV